MRFIQATKLNEYISSLKSDYENFKGDTLSAIESAGKISLQNFSLSQDASFLKSVSSVLNVIMSIITHPHISNKTEDVVIRVELANRLDHDAFVSTLKESNLWKRHGVKMIPEEIYYHQHEDELKIYENRFIVLLINLLDRELAKFNSFYFTRLPTIDSMSGADSGAIGENVMLIDRLRRKMSFIKNTYFYKFISKEKPISPKIQPTNILLKDRLYKFCFKFYRNFVKVEDVLVAKANLQSFYLILLLKAIIAEGYKLKYSENGLWRFESDSFTLEVKSVYERHIQLSVLWRENPEQKITHTLLFDVGFDGTVFENGEEIENYESLDTISLWELTEILDGRKKTVFSGSEEENIKSWLKSKTLTLSLPSAVYTKYCPICKSRESENDGALFTCRACHSEYVRGKDDASSIWIKKLRK